MTEGPLSCAKRLHVWQLDFNAANVQPLRNPDLTNGTGSLQIERIRSHHRLLKTWQPFQTPVELQILLTKKYQSRDCDAASHTRNDAKKNKKLPRFSRNCFAQQNANLESKAPQNLTSWRVSENFVLDSIICEDEFADKPTTNCDKFVTSSRPSASKTRGSHDC